MQYFSRIQLAIGKVPVLEPDDKSNISLFAPAAAGWPHFMNFHPIQLPSFHKDLSLAINRYILMLFKQFCIKMLTFSEILFW